MTGTRSFGSRCCQIFGGHGEALGEEEEEEEKLKINQRKMKARKNNNKKKIGDF